MTAAQRTDATGITHAPAGARPRIVSLVPSITELLFDMRLDESIVGRTTFCVHPANRIAAVKSVGGTKKINFGNLKALKPSHVIVNIDENPKHLAERIADEICPVIVTHPVEVEDNLGLYRLIGGIFDRHDGAEALCAQFETAYEDLRQTAATWPSRDVLYLIWQNPWMTVSRDTYVSRLLALANWHTVGNDPAIRYPEIAITRELLADIDAVLFSSEPFAFDTTHIEEFAGTFADTDQRLAAIDGEMTSWYGSRAILGLRYLKEFAAQLFPHVPDAPS